jgi:hypothetical protein
MVRIWINILFLIAAAYGSYNIITGKSYMAHAWQYYFCLLSPWILLFGSIKAWHRSYTWRRMMAEKNISPTLSRGHHQASKIKQHPSILEHASLCLFLTAIAAILKQFAITNIPWLMGGVWGSYFLLRIAIGMVK